MGVAIVVLISICIGLLVGLLVMLARRDARERRHESLPGSTAMPRERVEGEAHTIAARFAPDSGQNF